MSSSFNKSRRSFVLTAATGIGVMAAGFGSFTRLFGQLEIIDKDKGILSLAPSIWLEIKKDSSVVVTISRSELGQGVRTSFCMIAAEELDADWEKVSAVNAEGDSKYGNQSTGGSTSIRNLWNTLRTAGAQARMMLIAAAAQTWGIPESRCRTEKCIVYDTGSSRSLSYGDLIEKAASLPIPPASSVKLKDPSEFNIIGKTKWHIDNPEIVSGKAAYGSDYRKAGMKFAVVLRPPEIGGSLNKYNDTEAKEQPGVRGIYKIPEGIAVVADNTYLAMKASALISADWKPGKLSSVSSDTIRQELMNKIGTLPELPSLTVKTVESIYDLPLLAHSTMEPMSSFAHYHDGKCEVWTGTQNPQAARTAAANATGLPESSVRVDVLLSGGGFGRRHNNDYVGMAARISKLSGYPILLQYTKSDDIKKDYYRPLSIHAMKAGIDKDSNVTGWIHKVISQGDVSASNPPYTLPNMQNLKDSQPYSIPTGAWRSVESTQVVFANESMIDELAAVAKADPLQFRLKLTGNKRLRDVLQLAADKAGWTKELPANHGRGIACYTGYGGYAAHVVEVAVEEPGIVKVLRVVAAVDCGTAINPGNIEAQFMGAAIDALSTALKAEITILNGRIEQSGFHNYEWLTLQESPKIEVHIAPSGDSPSGIGELGFPSVSPALCNAIYDAVGIRVRRLPVKHTTLITKVKDNANTGEVKIRAYPDPFTEAFTLEIEPGMQKHVAAGVNIVDITGRNVYSFNLNIAVDKASRQVNLSDISSGPYFIIVTIDNATYSHRVIKL